MEIDSAIKSIAKKIVIDNQNNTWLLTEGNGVYKSVSSNFKHVNYAENVAITEITATHKNNKNIWFTDTNRNLYIVDSLGTRFVKKNNFKATTVTSDIHDNLWFGSQNKGIYIYRKQQDSLSTAKYSIERLYSKNGLPNDHIQNIIIQNNTIWVVTEKAGVLKLDYNFEQNFVKKISVFNQNNGLKALEIEVELNQTRYGFLR